MSGSRRRSSRATIAVARRRPRSRIGHRRVRWPHVDPETTMHPSTERLVPPRRRHRRVGHAGRRRQGQGPEGGRRAGHRLRRRRARLPDARPTSSRPPSRPAATRRNHRYTPGRRPARAARRPSPPRPLRDSGYEVAAGQVLVTNGGKHAVYNTFATLLDPGDEVLLPAPYWTTYPEPIAPRRRRARGRCPPTRRTGFRVTVDQLEAARTAAHQGAACSCRRRTRPARCTRATRSRPSAGGRVEHGIWVVTDEIYEHLTYGDHRVHARCPALVPELADRCVVLNGVAKTYAMTGWRVGWMIGPADVIKAATNLQSHSTSNVANVVAARRARRGGRRPRRRRRDARAPSTAAARPMHKLLNEHRRASPASSPQGAFYAFPSFDGRARPRRSRGRTADDHRRAGRGDPRRGQGGHRARRGVRRARLRPAVVRPRRRRPRRGHRPHRRPARRG